MRKAILNGGTNNCYGDASTQVGIKALEGHVSFIRALKKMALRAMCVSMAGLFTP